VRILVINAGSSSLKFTLFRMDGERVLAKGIVERIGLDEPRLRYEGRGVKIEEAAPIDTHRGALRLVCDKLVDPGCGALDDLAQVQAVGHRVAHGGEAFSGSVLVTPGVKSIIDALSALAPLHNPANLGGIQACEQVFDGIPNVAVFDTAFHQSMPPSSYLYAVPHSLYEEHGIRKYGFHGTSHKFVMQATADLLDRDVLTLKLITCHLGNGCSVAAIDGGEVLDTSMGLTPLSGLVMGTRCGDIDPGVVVHLARSGMSVESVDALLNKESGLLGVAGIDSSDMRDILSARAEGNTLAARAFEMFVYRLVFYIGAYHTALGGADAVVFTGGIGENSATIREAVIERLAVLGCTLDTDANETRGKAALVSTADSTLKAVVMPTNEELMIARDTKAVVTATQPTGS